MTGLRPLGLFALYFLMMSHTHPQTDKSPWQADSAVVEKFQTDRPGFCFEESGVPAYSLPPLWSGATPSREGWAVRRKEIRDLFAGLMFGHSPGRPESMDFSVREETEGVFEGRARSQRVDIRCVQGGREVVLECVLVLPVAAKKPVPVFLLLNNRRPAHTDPAQEIPSGFWPAADLIARGYGAAAISVRQMAPDAPEDFRNGVIHLFEGDKADRPGEAWGTLAAWAWGTQRVMDFFEIHSGVAATRVAVVGHSRGGKAALWAGATDERFALTISNASGCGGAALSRRRFGETLARLNERYPHWFCRDFQKFNERENDLPVDQHMLIALMAPRAVYVASAGEDLWADPRGEFLALAHASPVFELFGHRGLPPGDMPARDQAVQADRQAYHIRSGPHDLTRTDWKFFLDYADRLWGRPGSE